MRQVVTVLLGSALLASNARAAGAAEAGPGVDPFALIPLLLVLAWWVRGALAASGHPAATAGSEAPQRRLRLAVRPFEGVCFLLGWTALAVALASPLHRLGQELFSAHMIQHEILLQVAAPLLVLGRPRGAFVQAMPATWARELSWRVEESPARRIAAHLVHPIAAWIVAAITLWFWLLPGPFGLAMRNQLVHGLQHLTLLAAGMLFWWSLLQGPLRPARRSGIALHLVTAASMRLLLGALMVASGRLWYPIHLHTTSRWGLAPMEDQQLGAVLLWAPAGIAAIVMIAALFTGWLRLPGLKPGRTPEDLVRMARPFVPGREGDSGAWQH